MQLFIIAITGFARCPSKPYAASVTVRLINISLCERACNSVTLRHKVKSVRSPLILRDRSARCNRELVHQPERSSSAAQTEKRGKRTRRYILGCVYLLFYSRRSEITRECWFALHVHAVITALNKFASYLGSPSVLRLPHEDRTISESIETQEDFPIYEIVDSFTFLFQLRECWNDGTSVGPVSRISF